jgi:hypothetical protein
MKNAHKLESIILKGCPYSEALVSLLKAHHIKHNMIKVDTNTKNKYKTDIIDTFPQLYIIIRGRKLLIGGYNDVKNIINIINEYRHNLPEIKKHINLPNFKDKDLLRLIHAFVV